MMSTMPAAPSSQQEHVSSKKRRNCENAEAQSPTKKTKEPKPSNDNKFQDKNAASNDISSLPVIDLTAFGPNGNTNDQRAAAKTLRHAFSQVGFAYIVGHGCSEHVFEQAFTALKNLFDLKAADKHAMEAKNSPLYRGYNSVETGAHSCTPRAGHPDPDLKESFTIGATGTNSPMHGPNQWPSAEVCPGFQDSMETYWKTVIETVSPRLLRAFAMSLEMPDNDLDFFSRQCDDPVAQMVLLRYPPNPMDEENNNNSAEKCDLMRGRRGCGTHTDCGFLTILAQDEVEGLQVRKANGTWMSAPPVKGAFVVNLGDMAAQWTNDLYKSTQHRVYNASSTHARHSIPFFINCNFDTQVSCIPSCRNDQDNKAKYDTVSAGEYILKRLGLMHMMPAKKSSA